MVMAMEPAPAEPADLTRYTVERYFTLVEESVRDGWIEVRREPDIAARTYASLTTARTGDRIELLALPDARVAVEDLLTER